jgi:hypothetical protein
VHRENSSERLKGSQPSLKGVGPLIPSRRQLVGVDVRQDVLFGPVLQLLHQSAELSLQPVGFPVMLALHLASQRAPQRNMLLVLLHGGAVRVLPAWLAGWLATRAAPADFRRFDAPGPRSLATQAYRDRGSAIIAGCDKGMAHGQLT